MILRNPMCLHEVEPLSDVILLDFKIEKELFADIISGRFEPNGLLPVQMPDNMETVETQDEDVPMDMECYTDSEQNRYDIAFGMNFSGVIQDSRVKIYQKK